MKLYPTGGLLAVSLLILLAGCAGHKKPVPMHKDGGPAHYTIKGKRYKVLEHAKGFKESGIASWYGQDFHGRLTSSGESYNMHGMTAAHTRLPFGTHVRVTNQNNGRSVVVKINDRGPFHSDRILDLSYKAARKLDMIGDGSVPVRITALDSVKPRAHRTAQRPSPAGKQASRQARSKTDKPAQRGWLQAGAFRSVQSARQQKKRIEQAGLSTVKIVDPKPGDDIYRLHIGPFTSRQAMSRAKQRLTKAGL